MNLKKFYANNDRKKNYLQVYDTLTKCRVVDTQFAISKDLNARNDDELYWTTYGEMLITLQLFTTTWGLLIIAESITFEFINK